MISPAVHPRRFDVYIEHVPPLFHAISFHNRNPSDALGKKQETEILSRNFVDLWDFPTVLNAFEDKLRV